MKQTDLIIIGAGPGGYRAAQYAAEQGLKVVVFEQRHVGGTCLNEGCIPTKAYARNAEAMMLMRDSNTFGIVCDTLPAFRLDVAKMRKDQVIATLRSGVETLLAHPGITLVCAEARFTGANTVVADGETYTAPHIIVATGSEAKTLPLTTPPALPVLQAADLLQADRLPERLCIIGAGVIGMEFASIFAAFGSQVTVVEFLKECLPALDTDIAKRLRKAIEKSGVVFNMQSAVTAITADGVMFNDKKGRPVTVAADAVLMAVGRRPRIADDFAAAGFAYDGRMGIAVDDNMQTTVPGIYAIGDVNGRQMLAHAAEMQAMRAVNHIVGKTDEIRLDIMPAAIFTLPEAACVGPTEDQLKAAGTPYTCRKAYWRANGKALAMNEPEGMLKLFADDSDRIIGCHAYGAHAADIVQEAAALMCRQTTVSQLRHIVHIHPTLGEVLREAAE
jgi:dihydrolipoamide dehydrogenase